MAKTRLISAIVATGVVAAGLSAGIAWAGGPGGVVEDTSDISEAVGTGAFQGVLEGDSTPSAPPMTRPPPMSSRHAKQPAASIAPPTR